MTQSQKLCKSLAVYGASKSTPFSINVTRVSTRNQGARDLVKGENSVLIS